MMSFQNIRDFEKIELRAVRTTAVLIGGLQHPHQGPLSA